LDAIVEIELIAPKPVIVAIDASSTSQKAYSLSKSNIDSMTANGSKSWLRRAYWSQSITEVILHIPVQFLVSLSDTTLPSSGDAKNKTWTVDFSPNEIRIFHKSFGLVLDEPLEYNIKCADCTWAIESSADNEEYLFFVLYLAKTEPFERYDANISSL